MMISGAYGAVRELFPEHLWARLLAAISGVWGIGSLTGPAVGGFFASHGLWRAGFWTMVPLVTVAAVLSWRMLGRRPPRWPSEACRSAACSFCASPSSASARWPTSEP